MAGAYFMVHLNSFLILFDIAQVCFTFTCYHFWFASLWPDEKLVLQQICYSTTFGTSSSHLVCSFSDYTPSLKKCTMYTTCSCIILHCYTWWAMWVIHMHDWVLKVHEVCLCTLSTYLQLSPKDWTHFWLLTVIKFRQSHLYLMLIFESGIIFCYN